MVDECRRLHREQLGGTPIQRHHGLVGRHDHHAGLDVGQHLAGELLLLGHLLPKPQAAQGSGEVSQQMVNQFELFLAEFTANHAATESQYPKQPIVVIHRYGDFRAEQFKLALDPGFARRRVAAPQYFSFTGEIPLDPR